jgi:large repetitive protein
MNWLKNFLRLRSLLLLIALCTFTGTAFATLSINTTASTDLQVGLAYSQTTTASGGVTPVTFSISAGTLPAGLTLNSSTGTVSGTPTVSGSFSYTISATDSTSPTALTASTVVTGTINPATLTIDSTSLTNIEVGAGFDQTLLTTASSGTSLSTCSATGLPAGLSINNSCRISGNPTSAGSYTIVVTATSSPGGTTATMTYTGTVYARIAITTTPSANQQINLAYSQTSTVTGGVPPISYFISAGTLPAGLTLDASTGTVSGIPTTAGAFSYTITALDSYLISHGGLSSSSVISGIIAATPIQINTTSLNTFEVGASFSQTLAVQLVSGASLSSCSATGLPVGLSINNSCAISGTPTSSGAYSIVVTATSSTSATTTKTYTGSVNAALTLSTTLSTNKQVGASYSQTSTVTGGVAPITYSISAGTLPAGLTLNTSNGTVSGTPTTAGAFSYTITATDSYQTRIHRRWMMWLESRRLVNVRSHWD